MNIPDDLREKGKYWSNGVTLVDGCTRLSEGCKNCWALSMHKRFNSGSSTEFMPERIKYLDVGDKPKIFSIWNDLFHDCVSDEQIAQVWDVMFRHPQHVYLVLTKRAARMKSFCDQYAYRRCFGWIESQRAPIEYGEIIHMDDLYHRNQCGWKSDHGRDCEDSDGYICDYPPEKYDAYAETCSHGKLLCYSRGCPIATNNPHKDILDVNGLADQYEYDADGYPEDCDWMEIYRRPRDGMVKNVWLGVTAENQEWADKRFCVLLETRAARRFVSLEPLLGPVDLNGTAYGQDLGACDQCSGSGCDACLGKPSIDWVIVGAETGPGMRPCSIEWIEDVVQDCRSANVPVWVKAVQVNNKVVTNFDELPESVRVREMPK